MKTPTAIPLVEPAVDVPAVLPVAATRPPSRPALPTVLPVAEPAPVAAVVPVPEVKPAEGRPGPLDVVAWIWRVACSVCEWVFGALTLTITLAALAAVPVLQFLSLGYLLEAAGRIARTGRLRDGFIGVRPAARFGSAVL